MSFINTFMNGEQGLFKPVTLTPMQKLTLRFVVVGLLYYLFAVAEGMLMRLHLAAPGILMDDKQFFAIMTAHPLVGIFRFILFHRFRGISVPGSFPHEKATLEY